MRIGFDCDDVLLDFRSVIMAFHNGTHGTSLREEDFTTYDLYRVLGCEIDEAPRRLFECFDSQYYDKINPCPHAVELVSKLRDRHELFVITSRPRSLEGKTFSPLRKHFGDSFSGVHFTKSAWHSEGERTKGELCSDLQLDVIFEDSLEFAIDCASKNIRVYLVDYPYNQGLNGDFPLVHRISSLGEALKFSENFTH